MSPPFLREQLDRAASWITLTASDGDGSPVPVPELPPAWVVDTLLARGEWSLPPLEGIVTAPTLRRDGSLLDSPGYDALTGLLYEPEPGVQFPHPPNKDPGLGEATSAYERLIDPLHDFPFVGESDQSAAIAAILSIVGRFAIEGPVPMFAIRAPVPGAGKGLLADVISIVATGRPSARTTVPRNDDEARKRILAIGLRGSRVVLLDNASGTVGSESLAAALTAEEFADRFLGVNKIVEVRLHAVWLATGNNISFRGDLGRRVVPIDIDPRMENPEDRTDFKHPDLIRHVRAERVGLVAAALTLLRAYCAAGRPRHGGPRMGSYEAWDDLVRGALIWVRAGDPATGRTRIREEGDADVEALRALLLSWRGVYGDDSRTLQAAIAELPAHPELKVALAAFDRRSDGDRLTATTIAYSFRRLRGRICAGLVLDREREQGGKTLWRVVPPSAR